MRVFFISILVVAALGVPASAQTGDEPNTTCRLDAQAAAGTAAATVTCLQADPTTWGEMAGSVTVTLQRFGAMGWQTEARETCTNQSVEGVLVLRCSAAAQVPATDSVRGLIDLNAPQDWETVVADPTYSAGRPVEGALAADECGVDESTESSDLTLSDAPWADLCAVTIEPAAGSGITVVTHVVGALRERVASAAWAPTLRVGDCAHTVVVEDGATPGAIDARVDSRCGEHPQPCTGIPKTIFDLTGASCFTTSTWDREETFELPDNVVAFTEAGEVRVTLDPDKLSPLLEAALAPGGVITSVSALSSTGVNVSGDRAALDFDAADSTGRRYTIPSH